MDKNNSNPLRDISTWVAPDQAAAEHKRKKSEPKRILGAVVLSGLVSGFLAAAIGSVGDFFLFWMVSGLMLASWVISEKEGPGT